LSPKGRTWNWRKRIRKRSFWKKRLWQNGWMSKTSWI